MPVAAIVDNFDYGLSAAEIAQQFEISLESVSSVIAWAQSHRLAHSL